MACSKRGRKVFAPVSNDPIDPPRSLSAACCAPDVIDTKRTAVVQSTRVMLRIFLFSPVIGSRQITLLAHRSRFSFHEPRHHRLFRRKMLESRFNYRL